MSRIVLVLGASGFIGARVAAAAAGRGWTVRAGSRNPGEGQRRAPQHVWVKADFGELTTAAAWSPLMDGVEAVVNCVGVLQGGGGDSSRVAHVEGPAALFEACSEGGVARVVHLSAVGVGARTSYARDKLAGEEALAASGLDWIVVRPSLVVAREVYGGTALFRGLAGLPKLIPLVGGERSFRPVGIEDLASMMVGLLDGPAPAERVIEAAGPETISLAELILAYRGWLGFGAAHILSLPRVAALPVLLAGDLAAWLGWRSSLRTTSLKQLEYGAAGTGPATPGMRGFREVLATEPSGVQDRWHARLYFVRPIGVISLGLFWLMTGLIDLGPGGRAAEAILRRAGFAEWSGVASLAGAWLDVALGALLFVRRFTRSTALLMIVATLGYLLVATARLPDLWFDPLGPWLKVIPMMALCLFVAATDDRR